MTSSNDTSLRVRSFVRIQIVLQNGGFSFFSGRRFCVGGIERGRGGSLWTIKWYLKTFGKNFSNIYSTNLIFIFSLFFLFLSFFYFRVNIKADTRGHVFVAFVISDLSSSGDLLAFFFVCVFWTWKENE